MAGRGLIQYIPATLGVLAGASLVLLLWIVPAHAGHPPQTIVVDETHSIAWPANETRSENFSFSYNFTMPGSNPRAYEILPDLEYNWSSSPPKYAGGPTEFNDWMNLSVNGRLAVPNIHDRDQAGEEFTNFLGVPGGRAQMEHQDFFHAGVNEIRFDVSAYYPGQANRTGTMLATYGPLKITTYEVDLDGDGVMDAHQPIPSFPTPLVGVGGGILGGAVAFWVGGWALRRWRHGETPE